MKKWAKILILLRDEFKKKTEEDQFTEEFFMF